MGAGSMPVVFQAHQDGSEGLPLPFRPAGNTGAYIRCLKNLSQFKQSLTAQAGILHQPPAFWSREHGETEAVRKQLARLTQPKHLSKNINSVFTVCDEAIKTSGEDVALRRACRETKLTYMTAQAPDLHTQETDGGHH